MSLRGKALLRLHNLKTRVESAPIVSSRAFRILPWISLTVTVGILLLILRQAPPLPIQTDPQAADRVAEKMAQLHMAVQSTNPMCLRSTKQS